MATPYDLFKGCRGLVAETWLICRRCHGYALQGSGAIGGARWLMIFFCFFWGWMVFLGFLWYIYGDDRFIRRCVDNDSMGSVFTDWRFGLCPRSAQGAGFRLVCARRSAHRMFTAIYYRPAQNRFALGAAG